MTMYKAVKLINVSAYRRYWRPRHTKSLAYLYWTLLAVCLFPVAKGVSLGLLFVQTLCQIMVYVRISGI